MNSVIGVYNAEGSLKGELSYLIKKVMSKGSCSLCDLTHGWSPRMKRSWREACTQSDLQITLLHLDELSPEQVAAVCSAPVFITSLNGKWVEVMSKKEIKSHLSRPDNLLKDLQKKMVEASSIKEGLDI